VSAPSLPTLFVSHWQVSWSLMTIGALYGGLYVWAAVRRTSGRWPLRRTLAFLSGIACVLVALQSGIDTYDGRLESVHMTQHMLLLLLGPLLLLAGRPALLALRALAPGRGRRGLARALDRAGRLARPVPCLAVFSAVVVLTHVPGFYSATLRSGALHGVEHALYLFAGLVLWSPLLDVDPSPRRRLGGFGRLIYMLGAMPAMALVGAYLNRHPSLIYPAYGPPAHALGISAVADQQQAGAIMWVAGNLIMIAVGLWAAVAAMVAEERRQQAREARAIPGASS
jgi:cytochrome c oxidase assembly factor CtaG